MDESTTEVAGGPVLVGANWFRFRPGQVVENARVDSECYVWSVQGAGTIRVDGQSFLVKPGCVLRLPWRHAVAYEANPRQPFHLGTLHLIPWHDHRVPVEMVVPYGRRHRLFEAPWRRGSSDEERATVTAMPSTSVVGRSFVALGTYCIERFVAGCVGDAEARAMGVLVDSEGGRFGSEHEAVSWPPVLIAMTDHIAMNLSESLAVADVAASGDVSPTTAQRLFREFIGQSVGSWVRTRRMQEAARLLRTSGLRVNEVARAVGIQDPLYFSRLFRATYSVSPSRYLNSQTLP